MKRIYHHYTKMEEFKRGLWKTISNTKTRNILLKKAIKFTSNHRLYGFYMIKVVKKWKYSCEHNLSCEDMNRQAWIGHAACCLALNCPEDITRLAWHYLTQEQQDKANQEADSAILLWEKEQKNNKNNQLELFNA